jgi:hypothetical protein
MVENTLGITFGFEQSGPLALWPSCWSGLVLLALIWVWFGLVARQTRAFDFHNGFNHSRNALLDILCGFLHCLK